MESRTSDDIREEIAELVSEFYSLDCSDRLFIPGESPIPTAGKCIDHSEMNHMVQACLDGWLTTGRFNAEFESRLAEYVGIAHTMTINSGSSANLVAFNALTSPKLKQRAIQPGDEVITVAAGFPTTVNPIIQYGAVPVFVDIDIGTYNIAIDQLEAAISDKTRAVMVAHTLGNPFNLEAVTALCAKHDLWLIEDCCDALGSTFRGQMVGTFGDAATLSFYPAHHITMGEGGAVLLRDAKLKKIAESFRDWGRDCYCDPGVDNTCRKRFDWKLGDLPKGYDHKYTYSHAGYNLKISDMQAACGVAQLKKIKSFVSQRRHNFDFLMQKLVSYSDCLVLPTATLGSNPSWFGFAITIKPETGIDRGDLLKHLNGNKIGTRLLFGGNLVRQPYFKDRTYRCVGNLQNTDLVMRNTFWVGVHPSLTEAHLSYIAHEIGNFLNDRIR